MNYNSGFSRFTTAGWYVLVAALAVVGCEDAPATRAELDAIAAMQRVHSHVTTDSNGHAVSLALVHASIKDSDLAPLEELRYLNFLSLDGSTVTNAGLAHLAHLQELERLSLRGTRITDDGLAALVPLSSLQELDLEGLRISDAGLAHLAKIRTLRKVYFGPDGPSAGGIGRLQEALPSIHVFKR